MVTSYQSISSDERLQAALEDSRSDPAVKLNKKLAWTTVGWGIALFGAGVLGAVTAFGVNIPVFKQAVQILHHIDPSILKDQYIGMGSIALGLAGCVLASTGGVPLARERLRNIRHEENMSPLRSLTPSIEITERSLITQDFW